MEKTIAELDGTLVLNYVDDDVEIFESIGTEGAPKLDTSFDENQNPKLQSKATIVEGTPKKDKDLIIFLENRVLTPRKLVSAVDSDETNDSQALMLDAISSQPLNSTEIESNDAKTKRARSPDVSGILECSKTKKAKTINTLNGPIKDLNSNKLNDLVLTKVLESPKPKRGRPKSVEASKLLTSKVTTKSLISKPFKIKLLKIKKQKGLQGSKSIRGRPKAVASSKLNTSGTKTKLPPSISKNMGKKGLESQQDNIKMSIKTSQDLTLPKPKRGRPKGSGSKKLHTSLVSNSLEHSKTTELENRRVELKELDAPEKLTGTTGINLEGNQQAVSLEPKDLLEPSKPKRGRPKGFKIKDINVTNKDLQSLSSKKVDKEDEIPTLLDSSVVRNNLDFSHKTITLKALGLEVKNVIASIAVDNLEASSPQEIEDLTANTLVSSAGCESLVPSKRRGRSKGSQIKKDTFSAGAKTQESKGTEIKSLELKEINIENKDVDFKGLKSAKSKNNQGAAKSKETKDKNLEPRILNVTNKSNDIDSPKPKRGRPKGYLAKKVNPIAVAIGLKPSNMRKTSRQLNILESLSKIVVVSKTIESKEAESKSIEKDVKVRKLKTSIKKLGSLSPKCKTTEKKVSNKKQLDSAIETVDSKVLKAQRVNAKVLETKEVNISSLSNGMEFPKTNETKSTTRKAKQIDLSKETLSEFMKPKKTVVTNSGGLQQQNDTEIIDLQPAVGNILEVPKIKETKKKCGKAKQVDLSKDTAPESAKLKETVGTNLESLQQQNDIEIIDLQLAVRKGLEAPKTKETKKKGGKAKQVDLSKETVPEFVKPKETVVTNLEGLQQQNDIEIIDLQPAVGKGLEVPKTKETKKKGGKAKQVDLSKETVPEFVKPKETVVTNLESLQQQNDIEIIDLQPAVRKGLEAPKTKETKKKGGKAKQVDLSKETIPEFVKPKKTVVTNLESLQQQNDIEIIDLQPAVRKGLEAPKTKETKKKGGKAKQVDLSKETVPEFVKPKETVVTNLEGLQQQNDIEIIDPQPAVGKGLEVPKTKETKKKGRRAKQVDVSKASAALEHKKSKETVLKDLKPNQKDDIKIVDLQPIAVKCVKLPKTKEIKHRAGRTRQLAVSKELAPTRSMKSKETIIKDLEADHQDDIEIIDLQSTLAEGLELPKTKEAKIIDGRTKQLDVSKELASSEAKKSKDVVIDLEINEQDIEVVDLQPSMGKRLELSKAKDKNSGTAKHPDVRNKSTLLEEKIIDLQPPKPNAARPRSTAARKVKVVGTETKSPSKENIETIDLDLPDPKTSKEQSLEALKVNVDEKNRHLEPKASGKRTRELEISEENTDFKFPKPNRVKRVKAFVEPKITKPTKTERTEAKSVKQKQLDVSVGTSDMEPPKFKEAEVQSLPKKPMVCTVGTQTVEIPDDDIPEASEIKSSERKASVSSVGTQVLEPSKLKVAETNDSGRKTSVSNVEIVYLKAPSADNTEGRSLGEKKINLAAGKKPVEPVLPKQSKTSESGYRNEQNEEIVKNEHDYSSINVTAPAINTLDEAQEIGVKYETVEQIHTEFKYESQSETEEMMKRRRRLHGGSMRGRRRGVNKIEGQTKIDSFFKIVDLNGKIQMKCKNQIFKCDHCLYVGNSKANLERHSLIHRKPDEIIWFHCTECPYKSKYEHQLKSHFLVHMKPDQIQFFQCPHCEVKCSRKHNLTNHIKSIHSDREYSFKCAECDYTTFSKDRLVAHLKKHSKEVHACTLCKFVTKRKEYLESHFKMKHMEEVPRPFPCDTCSYKGKTKRELDKHYDRMHNKEQLHVYQCNHCSFNSIYKKNLEFHLLHMHNNSEGFQKFICGHCQKNFSYKNGLKVHIIRCHIKLPDDYWHKCIECKYKSKDVSTLKRHIKRNHGAPRLHCKQCSFATNRQSSMDAHLKTHEYDNEDILKCPECPYRIIQMSSFLYHMKVIHGKPVTSKEAEQYYMQDE